MPIIREALFRFNYKYISEAVFLGENIGKQFGIIDFNNNVSTYIS